MIKLIATDMDGTLLTDDKQLPQENIAALEQVSAAGVKVAICTGRMKSGVIPYFKELTIGDFAILNNGCSTYSTKDWSLTAYHALSLAEIADLVELCQAYPGIYLTLVEKENLYVLADHVPEIVAYDASLVFTQAIATDLATVEAEDFLVFQAMFMGDEELLDRFQQEQAANLAQQFSVVRSQSYIFEAMPKGVNKASALAELADRFALTPDQIMAIGDGNNDLEMLAYAGLGVAMGNATAEVKASTNYLTRTNEEAGVAQAIRTYILNKGLA
ncbi:Cof-type HAD-IIB family hydrolase [Streptococcus cuniculipharyngis]|uniref:HAD family phosphatase n=1 Tax=Streptococcus cuniculipharyngis TaxID=1562651 RepID=A0A5C5SBW5_9STRE|nr:Cof-type HAD-IIB family hydrolase [Streptococcus cuniculipharyngis]TWS96672.1 HAD family phosphatase [Streptococcus cuniculipharyngis]